MKLPPAMMARLELIKTEIVGTCDKCNGTGRDDDQEDCLCMNVYIYVMSLIIAGIPKDYWKLGLDELQMDSKYLDLVAFYLDHLDQAVENGKGIMFLGANGIGKTSLMCEIGKAAVAAGYTAQYFTAQQYVDSKTDRSKQLHFYEAGDFILLDEIDKVYIKPDTKYAVKALEEYIRRALSDQKCMVICTNLDEDEFTRVFGDSIMSMVRRNLRLVNVVGDDYSASLQESWQDVLTSDGYDYFHPAIVERALLLRDETREGFLG